MSDAFGCRALLVSAIASGQGKTTVTAALARRACRLGQRVRVFKAGPDFIDPTLLERASGQPVYNLDPWMVGEPDCRRLLDRATRECDLILVEGVMGLYDGRPSTADLARSLNLPVAVVVDGSAMAQTFGSLLRGLQATPGAPRIAGAIANRVASEGHADLLAASLPPDVPLLARLATDDRQALPERHLGLHMAAEITDLDARLDAAAAALLVTEAFGQLPAQRWRPVVENGSVRPLLQGLRIAVARDPAFCFLYPANLDTLNALGAELRFFSPLRDDALPDCEALYLPGGYPELHAATLSANGRLLGQLRAHHAAGKPLVAECGGLMLLMETLVDVRGRPHRLAGLLPGEARMCERVQAIGPQTLVTARGELRGHSFHHSRLESSARPAAWARHPHGGPGEAVFRERGLHASYVHAYFASNPEATAALFGG